MNNAPLQYKAPFGLAPTTIGVSLPVNGLEPPRIAVIGAGAAGAACAAGLLRAGFDVTVFDKSRGLGGRMATHRAQWADASGSTHVAEFDHGCSQFTATRPRFQATVKRAEALGYASRWSQQVYAAFPLPRERQVVVPTPNMPAFCRHLLSGVPLRLGHAVTGLQRCPGGWLLHLADDHAEGRTEGPFEQVLLTIPPAQAAMLLAGHQNDWAAALAAVRMAPRWTLMAVTDDLDWPWDAAEIDESERGELAWIGRNDRAPGRRITAGLVPWVAHATSAWSLAHLEDDPADVCKALRAALEKKLPRGLPVRWHHAGVHRWRYAQLANPAAGGFDCWWSAGLGLGVCGDSFGDGTVEAAWCSGDELADAVAASLDDTLDVQTVETADTTENVDTADSAKTAKTAKTTEAEPELADSTH